jgi:hypothetical protein
MLKKLLASETEISGTPSKLFLTGFPVTLILEGGKNFSMPG